MESMPWGVDQGSCEAQSGWDLRLGIHLSGCPVNDTSYFTANDWRWMCLCLLKERGPGLSKKKGDAASVAPLFLAK
jgi:hypothetical protein